MHENMMHKKGLAMQYVASALMPLEVGNKLPTISVLCAQSACSRGNIQAALDAIKASGAAQFHARGHLGTFLTEIDYFKLGAICNKNTLTGAMPLPYSKRYEGLATGIYAALNRGDAAGYITFSRGAGNRIHLLEDGRYDFVVLSALALEEYQKQGHALEAVVNFGASSYLDQHTVVVRKDFDGNWSGARIAIDDSSLDQQLLTKAYFKDKPVELVPMPYNQIYPCLRDGMIDGGVWNMEDTSIVRSNVRFLPLEHSAAASRATEAVVACRRDDRISQRLLSEALQREEICRVQQQVIEGARVPQY